MLQVVIGQEILLFIGKIIRFSTNLGKPLVIVVRRPSTTRGNGLMRGVKHQSGNMLDIHFDIAICWVWDWRFKYLLCES